MEPIVKFYEEEDDLMPQLRPLVQPGNIMQPFNKLLEKKWKKTLNEMGHVKPANEFLEAFMSCSSGRVVIYYIADLLNKLGLSVSYELFKNETGYDLFEVSLRHQMEEQIQYMYRPGFAEGEPQIIYKLSDFIQGQNYYNKNPELCYDRDVVAEVWEDLNLWPAIECGKKPVKRGRAEYEDFLLNMTMLRSTPNKKRPSKWERMRNYSNEMNDQRK